MKKLLLSVLCLTLLVSAAFFAGGCKKKHTHSFTEQTVKDEYLSAAADCTNKAKYFYSCSCGEKGSATFEYGEALNHSFTNYVSDNNATCTEDGTKTAKCDRCNQTDTITDIDSKLGHEFTDYVSDNNATYEKDGTKTAHCNRNGCTATDTIPDEGSELESKMSFKTLSVGDENVDGNITVSGIVPNSQTTFSFVDEIEVVGVIKYVVSLDIYGIRQVATRIVPLSEGENVVYIIELLNGESGTIYEVRIRRRPMYNVIYRTNGGTAVNSQTVEEGTIISAPETTRVGYTFESWSYDFSQPITDNTIITANWTANADTAYKTEYYLENLENSDYTLYETVDLQGTTDTTATAEIKTYDHFTFDEYRGVLSGNIAGDGSLVLKVFYTRNAYALSNENSSYGEITNETTKKYGSEEIKSIVTAEYLGCEFVGWFNGEKLLSTAKEYTFTVEYDVIARFKAKDEMSNFTFNTSVNTCEITGVNDNTVSEMIVPNCVTRIESTAFNKCDSLASVIWNAENCNNASRIFENCKNLANVKIGDNVKRISSSVFYNCSKITNIDIPDSVTSIGDSAFENCNSLANVTIGNGVKSIGNSAFEECSRFTDVIIPDGVTSIGDSAFAYCSSLANVTIPDSITSIGYHMLRDCYNLKYNEYNNGYYLGNRSNPYVILVKASNNSIFSCEINHNAKIIYGEAFINCNNLTSITIPDSIVSIGYGAFEGCSSLEIITIPFTGASKTANNGYDVVFGFIFGYRTEGYMFDQDPGNDYVDGAIWQYRIWHEPPAPWYTYFFYYIPESLKTVFLSEGATSISSSLFINCKLTVYRYSESKPTEEGNFWHYDTDGVTPKVW